MTVYTFKGNCVKKVSSLHTVCFKFSAGAAGAGGAACIPAFCLLLKHTGEGDHHIQRPEQILFGCYLCHCTHWTGGQNLPVEAGECSATLLLGQFVRVQASKHKCSTEQTYFNIILCSVQLSKRSYDVLSRL